VNIVLELDASKAVERMKERPEELNNKVDRQGIAFHKMINSQFAEATRTLDAYQTEQNSAELLKLAGMKKLEHTGLLTNEDRNLLLEHKEGIDNADFTHEEIMSQIGTPSSTTILVTARKTRHETHAELIAALNKKLGIKLLPLSEGECQ